MNGRPIPGATGPSLALPSVQVFYRGDYSVIVSNLAGATVSPEARLSVRTPPEVTLTPTQSVAYVATDEAFAATVAGNDFATLQWRHNGTEIPGETNEMLRLIGLNAAASGTYDVVVSTFGGTTTSSAAGLTISGALELVGTTPHRSATASGDYAPQLKVLPTGEFLIAASSNHLTGANIVLYKHAANGQLLWSTPFADAEFTNAEPSRIMLDAAGNIYVEGVSRQPYLNAAFAVLKFDANGQLLWSRLLTGTNLWGGVHAFAVNRQGNSTLAVLGTSALTVARYNSLGEEQWTLVDPSPDNDTVAVAMDASGNTYLGTTIRVSNDNEIRLRKFDATGATLWSRSYAQGHYNRLGALAVDASGHLIVSGTGELTDVPDSRMFVQKYSPAGEKLWETRTGNSWAEINYIIAMAVGAGDEITVLTMSDDDYILGEQAGVTRFGADGQIRYRVAEPRIVVSNPSQLALDDFGNAYVTGYGGRVVTGLDVVTAKYDPSGNRPWLVYYDGPVVTWNYSLAVGADAAGDIRVLTAENTGTEFAANFSVVHYRQRDPSNKFRLQLLLDPAATYHLGVPTGEPFRIEASADLQNWTLLTETEMQELLRPGATRFSGLQRFFRLIAE